MKMEMEPLNNVCRGTTDNMSRQSVVSTVIFWDEGVMNKME